MLLFWFRMKTIIFLPILLQVVEICVAKKEVNFIRLANCPEYKNTSALYKNVFIKRNKVGKSISISFDMVFKKEVKRALISATIWKCDYSGLPDSCEYYMKDFKIKNVCDIIGKENQIWSEAVTNSNFSGKCPLPAGTYRVGETKLDGYIQLTLMTIPTALWRIKFFLFDAGNDNEMVYCCNLELKIYTTRRN